MKKKFVVIEDSEPPDSLRQAEEPPGRHRHPATAAPFLPGLGRADIQTKHGPVIGRRFPIGSRTRFFMKRFYPQVSLSEWNDWRWQLRYRVRKLEVIEKMLRLSPDERQALSDYHEHLPLSVTPYYASLLDERDPNQPLRRSMIPVTAERLHGAGESDDPLHEDADSPVPGLVHRYPDRVLFLTTGFCSAYCRYCTRSRMVGGEATLTPALSRWEKAVEYIKASPQVRDVVISGGDPLTMADERLEWLLSRLRKIPHVEIVRLGTKVPVVLPQRITSSLTRMLRKYHPLWMSIHFTHPDEMTREVTEACSRLADAGIPMGSQTVLLAGINDSVDIMRRLVHGLLKVRVKPYYLYQCDPISGSSHFRTPVEKGIEIIQGLRGHTSGYAIPTYVIDAPGGGGKVPISPQYSVGRDGDYLLLRNYEGGLYRYPDPLNGDAQNCPVWPGA
ncbi:MAG: KamA family radical SAM protein [Deltaproteobacteria bacterium]|nr:KamA family radical SAM protein [Deltaproteobacteria bacterium]